MDRIVAFNLMYAAVDFDAVSLAGWIFVVFVGQPQILRWLHFGVAMGCVGICATSLLLSEFKSTLPIAIALASKWAYPPLNTK